MLPSSIADTYPDNSPWLKANPSQFKVADICSNSSLAAYRRRDFYKISLVVQGSSALKYADKTILIDQPALVFISPMAPFSWVASSDEYAGIFCIFTQAFWEAGSHMESLMESSFYRAGGEPVYFLNEAQIHSVEALFKRMQTEADSDYAYRDDLIRMHIRLLMHEAAKIHPADADSSPLQASARISKLFFALLERDFPANSPQTPITLKRAGDFADEMAVHVNHLNAVMKETTGKSTTALINDRIIAEAKSLLVHTDWSVSDIATSLGFEYAAYFNNFFRKHTGSTPLALRKVL